MPIEIIKGDITRVQADAIVNAANSSLMGGGGVDGAIHRAGGPSILEECKKIVAQQGSCPPGKAVITSAGHLPAKFVIHAVGPVWHGGNKQEEELLASCYKESLKLAVENHCRSVAFPNISTGAYCFPKKRAAEISVKTINEFLQQHQSGLHVIIVCFDDENFYCVSEVWKQLQTTASAPETR
ncbi:MAG: O-acetyl-ADP-ribose deacetylase [Chitinophagaceae bacterium]|nr:O-acetyl-ADP-ribose deacetylase [Chitinophagaceae bacterium]